MIEGLERVTTASLALALDAASLRQQAIAANIANANAIGYTPLRVSFEEQLTEARRMLDSAGSTDMSTLAQARPELVPVSNAITGLPASVQLDVEAAEMARNAVHYQALLKGLSGHFSVISIATADGRK